MADMVNDVATPTQLLQDALVDISDAERRQALHITPATGTLIRRLREVTTALSETLDGVYEAYRHLGEDTDGARNARELFGPMTGITNPAAWIALLIAEHRAEAEAEATPPQRPTDGDGGVWGTYVAYLHNLESAFEAAGLRQTETPNHANGGL